VFSWQSQGRGYLVLKLANVAALFFWIIFFIDGFLPGQNSVETIINFDEFAIHSMRGGRSGNNTYKKIITGQRDFTTYANENGYFITDTLELKLTPIFGLVTKYRQHSLDGSQPWIVHRLTSHRQPMLIIVSIALGVLTIIATLVDFDNQNFKILSFFTVAGSFIFWLSVVV